ncbi:MAG TPA: TonB-dependent receptor [Kofleriaceae bacterium]|nr:TonB-dependent receptor [Kofleriaceae bacterium]
MKWVAAMLVLLGSSIARADEPAIDVDDLPPLPIADEEPSSSATIMAASAAEEDVVVGAAKREQSLGNVASAVTVVSADRIRRFGYRTVAEAIAGVAGVYLQDTRLTQQVGIRGIQIPGGFNSRILLLVDGATVNEAWGAFGGVGWDGIVSIDDIARIEVIRGPVSSVYGTNAFFGIINIVTRGAAEGARAWGRVGVNSINGEVLTAGFAAGSLHRQLRGSVLVMNRIGDTSTLDEIAGGAELSADGGNTLIGALVGSSGGSFGQLRVYRSRRDSPFAPYDADPLLDPSYSLYNTQALLEGGHTREVSDRLTLGVRGYGTLYRYADRIRYAVDDTFLDFGDAATIGAEVRARYEVLEHGKLGVTAGAEANYNKTESRSFTEGMEGGPDSIVVPLDFNIEGVYAEVDSQPTEWLGLTAGARFDRNSAVEEGTRLSPRAALFVSKPERYGAKLLYAEGFRNPSAFEGFFEDGVDFSANPLIRPETIRSFEGVVWAKLYGLSARASAFHWEASDVIEQRPDPADPTGELLQFQNVGRYITKGVELEASYRNAAGWYAFGGVAIAAVGSEVAPGGKIDYGDVVNAPVVTTATGVSTPRLGGYAHVSVQLVTVGERATRPDPDGNASPRSPAWYDLDAAVYVPDLRGFDVTVGGRNLIGTRDLLPAPGDYDRFPDPMTTILVPRIPGEGREVYVKVGYQY